MKKVFVIYIFILCISVLTFCACNKTSKEISNMKDEEKVSEYMENDGEEILEEYVAFDEEDELIQKVNNNSFPVSDTPQTPATENLSKELISAAKYRNAQRVHELIVQGANVNFKDEDGYTPLHQAARKRNAEIVKILIENGANVNAETNYKETPLVYALDELSHFIYYNGGDIETEKLLINNGADLNIRSSSLSRIDDNKGFSPLEIATEIANKELIQLLLNKGAKVENIYTAAGVGNLELIKKFLPKATKEAVNSALYYAVKNGHKDISEYLIKQGAEIDNSLLFYAILGNNTDIVKLLLQNGANANATHYSEPVLRTAIEKKNSEIVKLLLNKGAQITEEDFKYAAQYGNAEIMKELFTKNIKVNLDDLLSIAIENGNKSVIDFLVSKGANTNNLRAAIAVGDKQKVKEYFKKGQVDTQVRRQNNGKEVKSFFELGKSSFIIDEKFTLLYLAAINNQVEIAKLLIDYGQDVNDGESLFSPGDGNGVIASETYYTSPLKIAVIKGYKEMVEYLISEGAELNIEDAEGKTELDYATNDEIKDILLKAGAEKGSGFKRYRF